MKRAGSRAVASIVVLAAAACSRPDAAPVAASASAAAVPPAPASQDPPAAPRAVAVAAQPGPSPSAARALLPGPDGRHALAIRSLGKQAIPLAAGGTVEVEDDRIVLVAVDSGEETEIARNDEKAGCLSLREPRFVDADTVLVVSYGYGDPSIHNLSVCLVDVPKRRLHLLARRTRCALPITVGRYKGHFFVNGMGFRVGSGPYDDPSVVTRTGAAVRHLTENPFAIDVDGDGLLTGDELHPECREAPPSAALEAVMKRL